MPTTTSGMCDVPAESHTREIYARGGVVGGGAGIGERIPERFEQVSLEPRQERLRLGIAEAAVVLEDTRAFSGEHQSGEQGADERCPPALELAEDRRARELHELRDIVVRERRHRRVGAHAAGVRTLVVVLAAFVVLRCRQRTSGASGPTTTRSTRSSCASGTREAGSSARAGWHVASLAIPGFPGAACSSVSRPLRASAHASACSRPPDPTTSTFTAPILEGLS